MTAMQIGLTLHRIALKGCESGGAKANFRDRALLLILLVVAQAFVTGPAVAQTRGGAVTIRYSTLSPFVALLAGILILFVPRLLNYIVAVYLILIGIFGV